MEHLDTDTLEMLFKLVQMHPLPDIPDEGITAEGIAADDIAAQDIAAQDTAAAAQIAEALQKRVLNRIKEGRRYNELDQIKQIVKFRRINQKTYQLQGPVDALKVLQARFEKYLSMFGYGMPLPIILTDVSSLNVSKMWPLMILDMQRYAFVGWALQSRSFCGPSLVAPGHCNFGDVRITESMNNPAFRDRTKGCGVVERFALAFYCQFRFDIDNQERNDANCEMIEGFILSGGIEVITTLMKMYRDNESIQMYLCFFWSIFFNNAERLSVLRFTMTPPTILQAILTADRYKQCRRVTNMLTPIISANILAAVLRFPYMMKMRHLCHLNTYMTQQDLETCNWQVCDWYNW